MNKTQKEIMKALELFGYLLPVGKRSNNWAFANLIQTNYSLNNPIVAQLHNTIRDNTDLYYYKSEILVSLLPTKLVQILILSKKLFKHILNILYYVKLFLLINAV